MQLTKSQLHTLRHMLGINTPWDKVPRPYRNYAAVVPGDPEFMELERIGAVEKYGKPPWSEYDYYRCTEAGKHAALKSHKSIRFPKAKRRYITFLHIRDSFHDLTFREFLTSSEYKSCCEDA